MASTQVLTIGVRGSGPGAGKDALSDFICEALAERGRTPRRERFATPLRECVEALTGVTVAESQTAEGKNREPPGWGMTVGRVLQRLGTDAVRTNLHGDAWVLALFRRFGPAETVVISDVRFPNEMAAVRYRKGIVVNVIRPEGKAPEEALAGRDPDHLSERALDGAAADHTIVNDGTLDDLRAKARDLVAEVYGPA